MAEEKRPLESEPQAAPEASTPDVPGAPAPDLSGDISQPVHDGPAQPDPGDVVISFEKIAGTRAAQAPPGPSPEGKGCVRGQGHEGGDAPQGPPTQG